MTKRKFPEMEMIRAEQARLIMLRRKTKAEQTALRIEKREFEKCLLDFRVMAAIAWDTVLSASPENLKRLRVALERSDVRWLGGRR